MTKHITKSCDKAISISELRSQGGWRPRSYPLHLNEIVETLHRSCVSFQSVSGLKRVGPLIGNTLSSQRSLFRQDEPSDYQKSRLGALATQIIS